MSLDSGGPVKFEPRPVEGAPAEAKNKSPRSLLLDGQQRITSLYQATLRGKVVETVTPKKKKVKRWFYIDIRKTLDPSVDREHAIVGVPKDKIVRAEFGREEVLDLSSPEKEYACLMYPVSKVFDCNKWQQGFNRYWLGHEDVGDEFVNFQNCVPDSFKLYQVPVIALDQSTATEAVCVVFEKVNTGGKTLDAFELITALYAASGHKLRQDWYGFEGTKGREKRFAQTLRYGDEEKRPVSSRVSAALISYRRFRFSILAAGVARPTSPENEARYCRPFRSADRHS